MDANPTNRAINRVNARRIVDATELGTEEVFEILELTLKTSHPALYLEPEANAHFYRLSKEIVQLADQLDFIGEMTSRIVRLLGVDTFDTRGQTVIDAIGQIYVAAREHQLPEWWATFRDARNQRSKHG